MKIMTALITLFVFSVANASDSSWLLCENGSLAVNVFEHRIGAQDRGASITLLVGIHSMKGELFNSSFGFVALRDFSSFDDGFNGNINIDYNNKKITLDGSLSLSGTFYSVHHNLSCKTMQFSL